MKVEERKSIRREAANKSVEASKTPIKSRDNNNKDISHVQTSPKKAMISNNKTEDSKISPSPVRKSSSDA
jgi:hypothetical protein